MEPLGIIVALFAAYFIGTSKQEQVTPVTSSVVVENQSCVELCNSGTVLQYKHCKCLVKPQWETSSESQDPR